MTWVITGSLEFGDCGCLIFVAQDYVDLACGVVLLSEENFMLV